MKTNGGQYEITNPNIFKNMTSGFAHQHISIFSLPIQRILVNLVDFSEERMKHGQLPIYSLF